MLQFIMERNVLLYVLAAACAVGVISQMILKGIYDQLIRENHPGVFLCSCDSDFCTARTSMKRSEMYRL